MTGPVRTAAPRLAALAAARSRSPEEWIICRLVGWAMATLLVAIACWPPVEVHMAGVAAGSLLLLVVVIHFVWSMLARVPGEVA